jgi:hypothetical protein
MVVRSMHYPVCVPPATSALWKDDRDSCTWLQGSRETKVLAHVVGCGPTVVAPSDNADQGHLFGMLSLLAHLGRSEALACVCKSRLPDHLHGRVDLFIRIEMEWLYLLGYAGL